MKLENKIKLFFYSRLLKLDCATCVSDSKLKKFVGANTLVSVSASKAAVKLKVEFEQIKKFACRIRQCISC